MSDKTIQDKTIDSLEPRGEQGALRRPKARVLSSSLVVASGVKTGGPQPPGTVYSIVRD